MAISRPFTLLVLLLQTIVYLGCSSIPKQDTGLYVYPPSPDEPRIVYLRSHYGSVDFESRNIFDYIFGASTNATLMTKPYGVFVRNGKIYITVSLGQEVQVIDTKLQQVDYIGQRGGVKLLQPMGVAVTRDNLVYVSDAALRKVFVFDEEGKFLRNIGAQHKFDNPAGIAINEELGRLYVCDSKAHEVEVFSLKGEYLFKFGKRGLDPGEFNFPTNVTIDKRTGDVLIVDTQNFRVQKFDKDGKFISMFGEIGDRPGNFSRPRGIALDSEGHIYVTDAAFSNFQVFDEKYQILMHVGWAGRGPGEFQAIAGIFIDDEDRIYAVDQLNSRVQVFQYLSEKWKRAHPEEYAKYLPQIKQ